MYLMIAFDTTLMVIMDVFNIFYISDVRSSHICINQISDNFIKSDTRLPVECKFMFP